MAATMAFGPGPRPRRRADVEPLPVLLNVEAGRGGARVRRRVAAAFAAAGLEAELIAVAPVRLAGEVRRVVERGAPMVAVGGGDGSISTAAGELAGRGTALLSVPIGTLNRFARSMGIDSPEAAARAAAEGGVVVLALASVNGRIFVSNASCGLYVHWLRHRNALRRWLAKWPAALVAAVMVSARLPRLEASLEHVGAERRHTAAAVWVGIGRGSFDLPPPRRSFEEARSLEAIVVPLSTRRALLALAARVLWRHFRHRPPAEEPGLERLHARRFVLEARHPVDVALDGEARRLAPPLVFRLEERGLRVVAPPP